MNVLNLNRIIAKSYSLMIYYGNNVWYYYCNECQGHSKVCLQCKNVAWYVAFYLI